MKAPQQWNDFPELRDEIAGMLDLSDGIIDVLASDEHGSYGERGYIDVIDENGRRFRLDLHEII